MKPNSTKKMSPRIKPSISGDILQEFQYFESLKGFSGAQNLGMSVLSSDDLELINSLFNDDLTDAQVFQLFELGDKYLATGRAKGRILKLLADAVFDHPVELPEHWSNFGLWNDFLVLLKEHPYNLDVREVAVYDSEEVTIDNLHHYLTPFFNLQRHLKRIEFRWDTWTLADSTHIASLLNSNLTEVSFLDVTFNFSEPFDLSR